MIKTFIITVSNLSFRHWLSPKAEPAGAATVASAGAKGAIVVGSERPVAVARSFSEPVTEGEISERYTAIRDAIAKSAAQNVKQLYIIDHGYLSLNGGNLGYLHGKGICAIICCAFFQAFRDLTTLHEMGYELQKFSLVDQFPHTSHIESIMLFKKLLVETV